MVGKISDSFGKFNTLFGTLLAMVMVAVWTNLGRSSLPCVVINVFLYLGIFSAA